MTLACALAPQDAQAQTITLTASPGDARVTLSWSYSGSGHTGWGYQVNTGRGWFATRLIPDSSAATRSHTFTGLTNGDLHRYVIYRRNADGTFATGGAASNTVEVTPQANLIPKPIGLTAVVARSSRVKLTWTNPNDPGIIRWEYQWQRIQGTASVNWTAIPSSGAGTTSYTVLRLGVGTYQFKIRAVSRSGNGAPSDAVSVEMPVVVLFATPDDSKIDLAWSTNTAFRGDDYWEVEYFTGTGGDQLRRIPGGGGIRSVTLPIAGGPAVVNGQRYSIRIVHRAQDGRARGESVINNRGWVTATPRAPTPTLVSGPDASATVESAGATTLVCYNLLAASQNTPQGLVKYLEARGGMTAVSAHSVLADPSLGVEITQAPAGITRGRGVNLNPCVNLGVGAHTVTWSWKGRDGTATVAATTSTTITVAERSSGAKTITLSVTSPSTSTSITEGDSGSTDVTVTATLGEPAQANFSFQVTLEGSSGGTAQGSSSGRDPCTPPLIPKDTDYCFPAGVTVSVAKGGTQGTMTVRIFGDTRDEQDETIQLIGYSDGWTSGRITLTIVDDDEGGAAKPVRPTGLSATPGNGQVTLAWSDPEDDSITGYQVQQRKGSDAWGGWTAISGSDATTVSHTVRGLDNDSEYRFRIRARNAGGNGAQSAVARATPTATITRPAAPTGLSAAAGNRQVTLSWTDPNNPTITQWQYRQKAGSGAWGEWTDMGGSGAATTRYEVSGLDNGTAYQFEVRAVNGAGNGAGPDAPVSATPTAPATSTPTTPTTPPATPTAGVTVTPTALTVAEGDSGSYTVALDTQPSGDVTVTVGGASGDVTTSLASLTFTSTNYNTAQTVTVTVAEDDDAVTDPAVTLTHSASGGGYGSVSIDAVTVTITENDAAAVTPSAEAAVTLSASVLTIQEGSSGHYTVVLDSQPTDDVNVTIGGASGDVSVRPASLTFTRANYATAQTVTVMAAEDEDATTDPAVTLTHSASGGGYGSVSIGAVTVTITENDETAVRLSASGLTVEEGSAGHYTVVLDSQPTDEVTVTIGGASGDVSVQPASLTFTRANYATAQTVTVTAAEDEDAAPDAAVTLTHSASGGGYDAVSIDAVTVTITEDDEAGVTLSASALTLEEGNSGHYTVVLDSQPTEEVTVTLGGVARDVSVQPASLTFTSANYATAQTVTVTVATDDDAVTEPAVTLTHNASGGEYGAVRIGTVTVTIREDDEAGVTLSASSLTLQEGRSGNYTVVLDSQPTDEVTVTPDSADSSALTVMPSALRFTAANWDTAQTVTVAAARDDDTDEETVRVSHAVSGGDYDSVVAPSVTVTVTDTTAAERAGRANRVNARVLPQVAAATLSQTLTAVTERIGAVASGQPAPASLQFGALPARTLEDEWDFLPRSEPSTPSVSEMLDGATFALPLQMSGDSAAIQPSGLAVWGRGERVSLSGTEEEVSWDGDLWSAHLGADMYIRPDLLAGAALSYGEGEVDTQTTESDGSRIAGTYETTLTAIHPYVSHMLADGSHLWGSMGYGQGEARIREGSATRKTDLSQWSVALGGRRVLLEEAERIAGGITRIALKGEGALAQLDTDAQQELTELTVKTTRLRLLLEGSHERALQGGATVTPALEAGLRHDGGDLGSGLGLEAGASVTWRNPRAGWLAELRARSLLAHEKDRDEWGISALVRMEPGVDGRGLSLSFGPEYGHTASGMESWFDYRLSPATANSAARDDMEGRLEAELGYGIGISRTGAMALLTPYTGFSLAQSGAETFRVGARYRLGERLSVGIEGKHQPQAVSENSWMLRAAIRW